jgi:hypothetical protein
MNQNLLNADLTALSDAQREFIFLLDGNINIRNFNLIDDEDEDWEVIKYDLRFEYTSAGDKKFYLPLSINIFNPLG